MTITWKLTVEEIKGNCYPISVRKVTANCVRNIYLYDCCIFLKNFSKNNARIKIAVKVEVKIVVKVNL